MTPGQQALCDAHEPWKDWGERLCDLICKTADDAGAPPAAVLMTLMTMTGAMIAETGNPELRECCVAILDASIKLCFEEKNRRLQ